MSVEQILEESRALAAVYAYSQGRGNMETALSQTEAVLATLDPPSDVVGHTTQAAMKFVTGHLVTPPEFEPSKKPYDRYLFEATARVWILWASQTDPDKAMKELQALKSPPAGAAGALHLMALNPWRDAVEALLRRDAAKARRLFWRASELGSQFGTESNPAVQWTYAASFFFSPTVNLD